MSFSDATMSDATGPIGWLQIIVLALVQGITEFLPISSSGHLILVPQFTDWPDQGLGFDLAVHFGTLTAVVYYFRRELVRMAIDFAASVRARREIGESRLAWAILWGTVPVGVAGVLLGSTVEHQLRAPLLIASTTIVFGIVLWVADARRGTRSEHELSWRDIIVIGCAQALALIPGTSRSGITVSAGMLLGLSRQGAARFSFLLAIPVTTLAATLKASQLAALDEPVDWLPMGVGAVLAGTTALLCIHYFLKALASVGMLPYVVYRLALGAMLLAVFPS